MVAKSRDRGVQEKWVQVLALPLISCVMFNKLLNLFQAQLQIGLKVTINLTYLRRLDEIIQVKVLKSLLDS